MQRSPFFGIALCTALLSAAAFAPTAARAQMYYNTSRTVAGGNPFTETFTANTAIVGRTSGNVLVPGVTIDVVSPGSLNGNDNFRTQLYSTSQLNILGGAVGNVDLMGDNTLTVAGGTLAGFNSSFLSGTTNVQISGGQVNVVPGAASQSFTRNTTTITGGTVGNGGILLSGGTVSLSGGTLSRLSHQNGTFAQTGGATQYIDLRPGGGGNVPARVTISGGTVGAGAAKGGITALSFASNLHPIALTVTGGIVNEGIFSRGTSTTDSFQFRGGTYTDFTKPLGVANPQFASFYILGDTSFDFYGTNLALSAPTAGSFFSTLDSEIGSGNILYSGFFQTITGTLENGQTINNRIFKATSGSGQIRLNPVGGAAAPEPGALALVAGPLALGALGVIRRRTH